MTKKITNVAGIMPLTLPEAAALTPGTPLVVLSTEGFDKETAPRFPVGTIVTYVSTYYQFVATKEAGSAYYYRFGLAPTLPSDDDYYNLRLPARAVDHLLLSYDDDGYVHTRAFPWNIAEMRAAILQAIRQQVPVPRPADEWAAVDLLVSRGYVVSKES